MSLKKLVESTNKQLDELNLPPKVIPMGGLNDLAKLKRAPRDNNYPFAGKYQDDGYVDGEDLELDDAHLGMDDVTQRRMSTAKGGKFKGDRMNQEDIEHLLTWAKILKSRGTEIPPEVEKMLSDYGI